MLSAALGKYQYGEAAASLIVSSNYWVLPAASALALRSAAVVPGAEKNREKTGWMKERKTI